MVALETPVCEFGLAAKPFALTGTDGNTWTLESCQGESGLLVMFICNHCPYVKAVLERIVRDVRELRQYHLGAAAIMSNDPAAYPEDSFDNMRALAERMDFPFPYLWDRDQSVADAYGAVCTPDFFGYNSALQLQYRGRLDASGMNPAPDGARRELFEAMKRIARTGLGPAEQTPSIGCSIKWR